MAYNSKPEKNNPLRQVALRCDEEGKVSLQTVDIPTDPDTFAEGLEKSMIIFPMESDPRLPPLLDPHPVSDWPSSKRSPRAVKTSNITSHVDITPLVRVLLDLIRHPPCGEVREGVEAWQGFSDPDFESSSDDGLLLNFNHGNHAERCPFGQVHDRRGVWVHVNRRHFQAMLGCHGSACSGKRFALGGIEPDLLPPSAEPISLPFAMPCCAEDAHIERGDDRSFFISPIESTPHPRFSPPLNPHTPCKEKIEEEAAEEEKEAEKGQEEKEEKEKQQEKQ